MKKILENNFKILVISLLLVITLVVIIPNVFSYAADENTSTIYSRDELSELLKDNQEDFVEFSELFSNSSKVKLYVNNERVNSIENNQDYELGGYSCSNDICSLRLRETYKFSFDSSQLVREFIVPKTGYYDIELWGSSGDNVIYSGSGSYVSGSLRLTEGEVLYLNLGSSGVNSYNSGNMTTTHSSNTYGYSGGGATDVRCFIDSNNKCVKNTANLAWDNTLGLNSRIMVAAGGGGGGTYCFVSHGADGGGIYGYDGEKLGANDGIIATKATQTSGGVGGTLLSMEEYPYQHGYFGLGGIRGLVGGGGGGYYGGGAGPHGDSTVGSGSSGSSYISGHTGCVAITSINDRTPKSGCLSGTTNNSCSIHPSTKEFMATTMIDGAGYSWTNVVGERVQMHNMNNYYYPLGQGHNSDGMAKITFSSLNNMVVAF